MIVAVAPVPRDGIEYHGGLRADYNVSGMCKETNKTEVTENGCYFMSPSQGAKTLGCLNELPNEKAQASRVDGTS